MSGITLRPCVQVGQPCVEGTRIPTRTIWNYVEGGDLREVVAEAFELGILEVERALQWEERLRAAVEPAAAVRPG